MIHFVGAGPGAPDLITIRGKKLLEEADVIVYAGSLVNPELLNYAKDKCEIHDSAKLNLDEMLEIYTQAEKRGLCTVRLCTGDPCLYGAIREQMDGLSERGIEYDYTPGVSAFCGAASALNMEYTLPGITQSVIITRIDGRTKVPERESVEELAKHGATMVFFLSAADSKRLSDRLLTAGVSENTPCAVVYKATWPEEMKFTCTLRELPSEMEKYGICKTALIIVGQEAAQSGYEKSKLYAADFSTGYREKSEMSHS